MINTSEMMNQFEQQDQRIAKLQAKLAEAENARVGWKREWMTAANNLVAEKQRADAAEAKLAAVREKAREGVLLATESNWLLGSSTHKVAKLFGGILDLTKE